MKNKFAVLSFVFAALASAQTTKTITVSIAGVTPAVVGDIRQHWLNQVFPVFAATTGAIDGTSTTVTVATSTAGLTAAQAAPAVGQAVVLDGEPMVLASISGQNLTFTRNTFPLTTMTTHASGVTIQQLKYSNPWDIVAEIIRNWMLNTVEPSLGNKSLTFGAVASGSVN